MFGAIIGDMVGSIYEFDPIKNKEFDIFDDHMFLTDDSILTMAVARVLLRHMPIDYSENGLSRIKKDLVGEFTKTVAENPHAGWGIMFYHWAKMSLNRGMADPYYSCGNGAAMRISPIGWVANSEEEVKKLSKAVTEITHNHPEGIKGAEAVAMCVYLARTGKTKDEIRDYVVTNYYSEIATLKFDELVERYEFDETCQRSCPQAIYCFLISNSLEDAVRNCVAIGGDCDTTGAMAGAIAEAFYSKNSRSGFEQNFAEKMIGSSTEEAINAFFEAVNRNLMIR